jgi:hypothetical protein
MDWATAGSIALGIFVGYVAMMFITRAVKTDATAKNFAAFLAVILAGTVVQFLTSQMGADATNFAQYAVGLGIGFILYLILYAVSGGERGTGPVVFPRRLDQT